MGPTNACAVFCFLESDRAITCVALAAESYFFRRIVVMELLVLSAFELPALSYFGLYTGVLLPTTPTHLRLENLPNLVLPSLAVRAAVPRLAFYPGPLTLLLLSCYLV